MPAPEMTKPPRGRLCFIAAAREPLELAACALGDLPDARFGL
jgi:hypothetical protein